jgi:hypothetical protein
MAIPSIPQKFYLQQAAGKTWLQWDLVAGATTYSVERSTDGVTYSVIASPATNYYEDTTVTVGTLYYYQVASTNSDGTSPYTDPQSTVPTLAGEMSLVEIGTRALQKADRFGSDFIQLPELNSMINNSLAELYDLLITAYEDYFKAPNAIFYTSGNQMSYSIPNGATSFYDDSGASFVAEPVYKLLGVDLSAGSANNGWLTVSKFMFAERNRYVYPNSASQIYGVLNLQYRFMGSKIEFIPTPSANQAVRLQYIPRLAQLIKPWDITTTNISGWLEYVLVDVAIKILQKEESDTTELERQKMMLKQRIEEAAQNKDAGRPDTISDVTGYNNGGYGWGSGPMGGF